MSSHTRTNDQSPIFLPKPKAHSPNTVDNPQAPPIAHKDGSHVLLAELFSAGLHPAQPLAL